MMNMDFSNLIELTSAPALYQPGTHRMWDDTYISGQLLRIHLDQNTDAASRKIPTILRTVEWIETHLKSHSTILDLGCGPGLYDVLLAEQGHHVTGVDCSRNSIEYAKSQAQKKDLDITYLHQDYLEMDLEKRYDLVIMIYCDFSVLIPRDRDLVLHRIQTMLNPGGLFIFDILNEQAPVIMNIDKRDWEIAESGFWKPHPYLALSQSFHYPDQSVILQQHIICSEKEKIETYRFWNHYYRTEKMRSILKNAGFSDVQTDENLLSEDVTDQNKMVTFYIAHK